MPQLLFLKIRTLPKPTILVEDFAPFFRCECYRAKTIPNVYKSICVFMMISPIVLLGKHLIIIWECNS